MLTKKPHRIRTKPSRSKAKKPLDRAELSEIMAAADPIFMQKFQAWVEYIYLHDRHLDIRDRQLVMTGILSALRAPPPHIKEHMEKALRAGASKDQLIGLVQLVGAWAGTVAQANALEAWRLQFTPELPGIFEPLKK